MNQIPLYTEEGKEILVNQKALTPEYINELLKEKLCKESRAYLKSLLK